VLVSFIGGNLERPVIMGCLYDKQHQPPTMGPPERASTLPSSASWLGWTYSSIGDKSRQTMLNMDVTSGSEMMFFNAPFDWRQDVGNDCDVRIKRDELRRINRNFSEKVDGKYDHVVDGDRTEHVKGKYSLTVDGDSTVSMSGKMTGTFSGAVSTTCKAGVTSYVDRGNTENVQSGDRVTRVSGGSCRFGVSGAFVVTAGSVSIGVGGMGGASGPATGGALSLGQTSMLDCVGGATVQSGPSSVGTTAEGVTLKGPATHLRDQAGGSATLANGSYLVDVPQGITFRCGMTELRLTPQGLFVNGQQLVLQAARTEIKTASFDINAPDGDDG
jgi:type VI secretion system secreted protein VgrG